MAACELTAPEPLDLVAGTAVVEVDGRVFRARAYYHVERYGGEPWEVVALNLAPGDTLYLLAPHLRPGIARVDSFRTVAEFEARHPSPDEEAIFVVVRGHLQIDAAEGATVRGSFDLVLVDALASCLVCETTRKEVVSGRFHTVAR